MTFLLDIVSTPAILVALIAIVGLLLQKSLLLTLLREALRPLLGF